MQCESNKMETPERNVTDFLLWVAGLTLGLAGLYLTLYFLCVRPSRVGGFVAFTPDGKAIYYKPDYHGMPPKVFAPMYELDRAFLRKDMWRFSGRVWSLASPTLRSTNGLTGSESPLSGGLIEKPFKKP